MELIEGRPLDGGVFDGRGGSEEVDCEEDDEEGRAGFVVFEEGFVGHQGGVDSEFLLKFAAHGISVGFTGFALSAGKLPESSMVLGWRALADHDGVLALDNACDHTGQVWMSGGMVGR